MCDTENHNPATGHTSVITTTSRMSNGSGTARKYRTTNETATITMLISDTTRTRENLITYSRTRQTYNTPTKPPTSAITTKVKANAKKLSTVPSYPPPAIGTPGTRPSTNRPTT